MTKASGAVSRAVAQRKADALTARRAARFEQRERELHALVTDYHHAADQAARIRSNAQARAARIIADAEAKAADLRGRAEKDAAEFEQAALGAVRAMLEFGESPRSLVELTGLRAAAIRRLQPSLPGRRARRRARRYRVRPSRRPGRVVLVPGRRRVREEDQRKMDGSGAYGAGEVFQGRVGLVAPPVRPLLD